MDEVLFRSGDKLENLQFRLGLAANGSKKIIENFNQSSKRILWQCLHSAPALEVQTRLDSILKLIIKILKDGRSSVAHRIQPILKHFKFRSKYQRAGNFKATISARGINTTIMICLVSFVCGTAMGIIIGRHIYQRHIVIPCDKMQAIQCLNYQLTGNATDVVSLVHGVDAPNVCRPHEVIIQVEAGSLQLIDLGIAKGYGQQMRYCLNKFRKLREFTCPVTLGRDCVGTVLSVGVAVRRIEVGDSVWVAVPYWAPGVLSQRVIVPDHCVAIRPARFGMQASCSFPYAGALALHALRHSRIQGRTDAVNKRVLIIGGCTPVGCLLTQILTAWGAHVTATCPARAPPVMDALGAADIIPIHYNTMVSPSTQRATGDNSESEEGAANDLQSPRTESSVELAENDRDQLLRHLRCRPSFDLIITTMECHLTMDQLLYYCSKGGMILDTRPMALNSDRYGALRISLFGWYMRWKFFLQGVFGSNNLNSFNEVPMDFEVLDLLSTILEKYRIKPVIGKVYHATDIVSALKHVSASNSIGTTVVTFHR